MLGIRQPSDAGLEYCAALITEYTALDCAQVLTLLKRYGGISRHDRNHIVKLLCRGHAKKVEAGERSYFVRRPLRVEGPLLWQVRCFWVLLDYLDRGMDVNRFRRMYDFREMRTISPEPQGRRSVR